MQPAIALRSSALFPHMAMPLAVGRPHSVAAVEAAASHPDKTILTFAQRASGIEDPTQEDLYHVGTRAKIQRLIQLKGAMQIVLQGVERVQLVQLHHTDKGLAAEYEVLPAPTDSGDEVEALNLEVRALALQILALAGGTLQVDLSDLADDPLHLVYFLASIMSLDIDKEQAILEADTRLDALRLMRDYLNHEVQVWQVRRKVANRVETEMTDDKRKYILRQQLRAIQQELGEDAGEAAEIDLLRERIDKADLPDEVRKEAERELERLAKLPRQAPDHQVLRSYLELVLELPWKTLTEDRLDLQLAREILDEDHYGLKEIKERILEHLAVMKLNPGAKAPILCLVGPPGVGKTSLGQSIARALERKFERMSLGGLHDEAELRGHRRTYVGAMPGRLVQAMRRAGARNPVLMLDEIDKLGMGYRGDPASALLEILDPAQNGTFRDNYLDLPFDLSKVFFIATANTLDTIPRPLLDRMEVLRLSGYTEGEKEHIARRYLLPRQLSETGLTPEDLSLDDATLQEVIGRYTREAGVRQLERALGRLARKVALRKATEDQPVTVAVGDLKEMLGKERHRPEQARKGVEPGVVAGMAWTEAGGDVLYVEALVMEPGAEHGVTITGQLGDVMQESARAARSWVLSRADRLGIPPERRKHSVHVHVPAGAVPKDGPSAGVTMATALASAYSGVPVRTDTAMTGEITLTGLVLPVGGIKEKVLAAARAGMTRIVLPRENEVDLDDIPQEVRDRLEVLLADRIEDVLDAAVPGLAVLPPPVSAN